MNSKHLPYWLATLYFKEVGPKTLMRWLLAFKDIETLFHASIAELHAAGIKPKQIEMIKNPDWKSVEKDLAWAALPHHDLLSYQEEAYPYLLKQIPDPPLILYVKGNKEALSRKQLAIVGARNATQEGIKNAENFAFCLAKAGLAITSGLARGIDGASHRGALLAGGVTISVLGTGLNCIYPSSNRQLVEDIVSQQGVIISELPLSIPPKGMNFPRRNRIIAALSVGVLIVEAAMKSGSLITARYALDFGREIFAIPGSIHHPLTKGCHYLIRQGAKLVEKDTDILEELGILRQTTLSFHSQNDQLQEELSPDYQRLLMQIDYETTSIDMILLRSRLTASEVSSMLLTLELNGYIQSVPGGYIRAVTT